jgi:hypothetical protein
MKGDRMTLQPEGETSKFVEKLPHSVREAVSSFYGLPLLPKDELLALIDRYADSVGEAATQRGDLDVHLADCVSRCCITLVREHWDDEVDDRKRLIQSACLYYVKQDDGCSDLKSAYGFDDDAQLLNVVVAHLGRPDLTILI